MKTIDNAVLAGYNAGIERRTVRMLDTHEEIIGLSGHLLAVSRKIIK